MKLVIDLTSLADNFSGIERYTLNIAKQMLINDKNNDYVIVFKNFIHKEFEKFINNPNVKFKIISGKNKLIFNQFILPHTLYRIKADKYLFLAFPSPIFFIRKGIINTIHDLTCWDYPNTMKLGSKIYFKKSIKNAIKVSEKIITVSEFSKKRIQEKFKVNNISVIYNGISEVFIKSKYNVNKDIIDDICKKYSLPDEYIMCLCTLEPRKNVKLLIDAYIELREYNKVNIKLVLVGRRGWKIEKLLNEVNEKYSKDIIITGFVDDDDLPIIYSKANVFVFPSLYEGFGIPVIEAMYSGIPVICSNTSSLPEVVDKYGILFSNNDKEELKVSIEKVIKMPKDKLINISKKGKERVKKFNWCNEANKLIKLLE